MNKIIHGECLEELKKLPDDSVDLVCTDPPYGIGFMGKEWDTFKPEVIKKGVERSSRKDATLKHTETRDKGSAAMESARYDHTPAGARKFREWFTEISIEMLRVLKPGAFAFVCIGARQDSVAALITAMTEAGFKTDFTSLFWTYASGFPKASNVGKRTGKKEMQGAYSGFQPKPAVEVIIVAMKPLSEKTYVDQALKNGKGITWLDDCRVPTNVKLSGGSGRIGGFAGKEQDNKGLSEYRVEGDERGRFPANLLVSDDVLNDGRVTKSGQNNIRRQEGKFVEHTLGGAGLEQQSHADSGSYSRYFDLDAWAKTLPFLITPKASKREKNESLDGFEEVIRSDRNAVKNIGANNPRNRTETAKQNHHPTVKPLKLMSYLITLGSREGDVVLDPFLGSGTTALAAKNLKRKYIGIEREREYVEIAEARLTEVQATLL